MRKEKQIPKLDNFLEAKNLNECYIIAILLFYSNILLAVEFFKAKSAKSQKSEKKQKSIGIFRPKDVFNIIEWKLFQTLLNIFLWEGKLYISIICTSKHFLNHLQHISLCST